MRPPEFDLKTIRGLPSIEEQKEWRDAGARFVDRQEHSLMVSERGL